MKRCSSIMQYAISARHFLSLNCSYTFTAKKEKKLHSTQCRGGSKVLSLIDDLQNQ